MDDFYILAGPAYLAPGAADEPVLFHGGDIVRSRRGADLVSRGRARRCPPLGALPMAVLNLPADLDPVAAALAILRLGALVRPAVPSLASHLSLADLPGAGLIGSAGGWLNDRAQIVNVFRAVPSAEVWPAFLEPADGITRRWAWRRGAIREVAEVARFRR